MVAVTNSTDNSTTKLLIELQDGGKIEAVIIRYGQVELRNYPSDLQRRDADGNLEFTSNARATLCVSSQVGCKMGCTFCATGTMGLRRNLTTAEIIEQMYHANQIDPIRNVVFMGMGEPLDNYDAVIKACRAMTDVRRFGLASSRISISTVGVVPRMLQLAEDGPEFGLALSLHAPNQQLRSQIVPTAKAWPLPKIIDAMENFITAQATRNKIRSHVLIEYVLISGINDSDDNAHELGQLLKNRSVLVNVIPYNPTDVPHDYKPPTREGTERFTTILKDEYGLKMRIRQEMGQDVNAACGQLVVRDEINRNVVGGMGKNSSCTSSKDVKDVEDVEDLVPRKVSRQDEDEEEDVIDQGQDREDDRMESNTEPQIRYRKRPNGALGSDEVAAALRKKNAIDQIAVRRALMSKGYATPGKDGKLVRNTRHGQVLQRIPLVGPIFAGMNVGIGPTSIVIFALILVLVMRFMFPFLIKSLA